MSTPAEQFAELLAAHAAPLDTSIEALFGNDPRTWIEANVRAAFDPAVAQRVAEVQDAIQRLSEASE